MDCPVYLQDGRNSHHGIFCLQMGECDPRLGGARGLNYVRTATGTPNASMVPAIAPKTGSIHVLAIMAEPQTHYSSTQWGPF